MLDLHPHINPFSLAKKNHTHIYNEASRNIFRNTLRRQNWASLAAVSEDKEDNEEVRRQRQDDIRGGADCVFQGL